MIFITLGSQKFQFDRLLKEVDRLAKEGLFEEEVFAQIGYSTYKPQYFEYKEFLDRDEFAKYMDKSDIVITHGGTGAIIGAVKKEKKVIAVPRLARYGEHVDDHQTQIVEQFTDSNLISSVVDIRDLKDKYIDIKNHKFEKYISNTQRIIDSIDNFIDTGF